ncbi:MAG: helix-turn-helix domain-containing protein [Elainellaceae cyanobacterium]
MPREQAVDLSTELSTQMRELRQHLDLSQRRFAAWLKVSVRTVNRWENGHTLPSPLAIRMLEEKLQDETFRHPFGPPSSAELGAARAIADALRGAITQARSPLDSDPDAAT